MIQDNLAHDRKIDKRLQTLKQLPFVTIKTVDEYDKMPRLEPIDNQIHFFDDGIEAIVGSKPSADRFEYSCKIIHEKRKLVIEYTFEGTNFRQLMNY